MQKKRFILFLSLFLSTQLVCGQWSNFSLGVKAGPNLIFAFTALDADPQIGITAGLNAEYFINDKLRLELGLDYSSFGAKIENQPIESIDQVEEARSEGYIDLIENFTNMTIPLEGNLNVDYSVDYFNIPLVAKFKLSSKFSFLIGPQLGILLSAKTNSSAPAATIDALNQSLTTIDQNANTLEGIVETNATFGTQTLGQLSLLFPQFSSLFPAEFEDRTLNSVLSDVREAQTQLEIISEEWTRTGNDDRIQTLDFGIAGGIEWNLSNHFYIDGRTYFGLTNFLNDGVIDESAKNIFITLGLGYKF